MPERSVAPDPATRLHVREDGPTDAPALLLCNSLGTDVSLWDGQVATWGRSRRIVRFDQRGHGRSDAPPGPYTVERLGRDALAVLDACDVAAADVCGLSLGGLVALWLAANAPDRVGRLVLADTAARVGTEDGWRQRADTVRARGMEAVASVVLERFFSPGFLERGGPALARTRARLLATDPEGYAASCEALATADLRDLVRRVAAETLVVVGGADAATPPEEAEALAAGIPAARLVVLPGAGHLANLEQPEAFAAVVDDFLERAPTTRGPA